MDTIQSIQKIIQRSICDSESTFSAYQKRLGEGLPTRDENPSSHFCAYFLPFNASEKRVFIVHHKKSGLWISPGGHMDKGETLLDALNREIDEELGIKDFFAQEPAPFLLTITPMENRAHRCKSHYDIWYVVPTDGSDFKIDPEEFHDTKWMTIEEAERVVTDSANRRALEAIKKNL